MTDEEIREALVALDAEEPGALAYAYEQRS